MQILIYLVFSFLAVTHFSRELWAETSSFDLVGKVTKMDQKNIVVTVAGQNFVFERAKIVSHNPQNKSLKVGDDFYLTIEPKQLKTK